MKLKITQAEFAEKTGITEQTIYKTEHFEDNLQLDLL
jgi:DNA-binding XRE family transcriptional regulator